MPLSPLEVGELAGRYMDRQPLDQAEVDIQRLIIHLDQIAAPAFNEHVMAAVVVHALTCPRRGACNDFAPWEFETRLVQLAATATLAQRAHLAAGFPAMIAMVEMASDPDQLARLQRIARGQEHF